MNFLGRVKIDSGALNFRRGKKQRDRDGKKQCTYSLWKKAVARTQSSAVAQRDSSSGCFRLIFNDFLATVVTNKLLEPVHQIGVSANEIADFVYEDVFANEVLREQVAELQEFVHGLLVGNVFLDSIKESQLF